MPNPLKIAPPPRRPNAAEMEPAEPAPLPVREAEPAPAERAKPVLAAAGKFRQVKEDDACPVQQARDAGRGGRL